MSVPRQAVTPLPHEVSRRVVPTVGVLLVVTALAASVVTSPQLLAPAAEGIRDAGPISDLAAPVLRGLRVLGAVATVGALVIASLLGGSDRASDLQRAASRWAMLWSVAAGCAIVLEISLTSGVPIAEVLGGGGPGFASGVEVTGLAGTAWLAAVVSFLAHRVRSSAGLGTVLLVAASALVMPVLTGHAGHAAFDVRASVALALHVLAVSAWAGGLLALCAHAGESTRLDMTVLRRFGVVALVCYVVVVLSGVANLAARLSVTELATDGGAYSVLLLLKVSLFVVLGLMGLTHRRRTLGRAGDGTTSAFWSVAVTEVAVMAAALGLAVSLTATAPGGSDDDGHAAPAGISRLLDAADAGWPLDEVGR